MLAIVTGCGDAEPDETEFVEPEPIVLDREQNVEPLEPEPEPEIILPYEYILTGEGSAEDVRDRPVVVMVENSPNARPQSGLHAADIVYETLAEGNITRFVAVYQSDAPELIGPVRSIRPYLIRIGDGFDAIIVHAGWSPEAEQMLTTTRRATLNFLLADHVYSWRSNERKAPHNLYTSMEKIREGAEKKQYRTESKELVLAFAEPDAEVEGNDAARVKVNYIQGYHVAYEYDEEAGYYERYMLDEAHQDKETGTQLIAHNIIIIESRHRVTDSVGRRDIDIYGPGEGYLVQKGKVQEVTWNGEDGLIRVYKDDEELPLTPGKTWINIVPIGTTVEIEYGR